jgi:hypothetical protein
VSASPSSNSTSVSSRGQVDISAHGVSTEFVRPLAAVLGGIAFLLAVEIVIVLMATHGHLVYPLEAAYTHLALAEQISVGHYGLVAGEAAAPSSSILYPFLLAALRPFGLGVMLPLVINLASTLAAGVFAVLLARECRIPLQRVPPLCLFVLAAVVTLALDLPGLAMTGLEHSFHVAMTVAYLLGLVRFVVRGRCDWWWIACIIIQPIVRFEAAGMLVADALIFVAFRRYAYALAMVAIGVLLVGGYSLFLHSLGLPLLPSSVLARSDWSNAAAVSHSGLFSVIVALLKNLNSNLNSFGAAQMLGAIVLGLVWLSSVWNTLSQRPLEKSVQIKLVTLAFMTFVTFAQLAGGKLGWTPSRYEAYVLVLNLCSVAILYREQVSAWCERANWRGVVVVSTALLLIFAGYATQFVLIPTMAGKEYQGPYQLHRFVTRFYRAPVAVDQIGYVNFENRSYVLDLSGLGSEAAREQRARARTTEWMDGLLASKDVGLAIVDSAVDPSVPAAWTMIGEMRLGGALSGDTSRRYIFYARRPEDVAAASTALERFAPTLPPSVRLLRTGPGAAE